MLIRQNEAFPYGYTPIATMDETENNMMMDFGILKLGKEQVSIDKEQKERAFLLIQGQVIFQWEDQKITVKRSSCFDESPWCLHVPAGIEVSITGVDDTSELSISKTNNDTSFPSKLYTPEECASEERGKGTMGETSTRIVRTIFDWSNQKQSNLVLGEVITFPGKWSSYPPHHHPQPEIYYYRFYPENGFGYATVGDEVIKVTHNDTVKIPDGNVHPQAAAPGYAMYYVWVIRHLEGNPYITPTFVPEHLWVTEKDAKIWPSK